MSKIMVPLDVLMGVLVVIIIIIIIASSVTYDVETKRCESAFTLAKTTADSLLIVRANPECATRIR